MNLYILVLDGSGCSQSFLGTLRESMSNDQENQRKFEKNLEKKKLKGKRKWMQLRASIRQR
jgi:hypothetical protein